MIDFLLNLALNLALKIHQNPTQEAPKADKKSIIWPLVGKLAEVAKMLQNDCFCHYFWLPRPSNFEAKFNKKRTQTDQNSSKNLVSILIQFLTDFGGQLGSKTLPKPDQNQ